MASLHRKTNRGRPRFGFRFRLITLIALVALFAGVFAGARAWLDRRPPDWRVFSAKAFAEVPGDCPIVVFVGADWDTNSSYLRATALIDQDLVAYFNRHSVRAFYLDITNRPSPEQQSFLDKIDCKTSPTIAVFPKGPRSNPEVLRDMVSAEQILDSFQ